MASARCPVCGRNVRTTKNGQLARHDSSYANRCPNSGSTTTGRSDTK